MKRKDIFAGGEIFHICNKSISNYGIFKDPNNGRRFLELLDYYNDSTVNISYSDYINSKGMYEYKNLLIVRDTAQIKFLAYTIMPDHYHLLVKIISGNFSSYIGRVENSFSHFFNLKFKRKGPLWQSRFRSVRITSNEQLLHVHRYIHLNPTSSNLVNKPENWELSSYKDFISDEIYLKQIATEISIRNPIYYKKFVEDQQDFQRKLKAIKKLLLE